MKWTLKVSIFIILLSPFFPGHSYAGLFNSAPPEDFLKLETCSTLSKYSCTLKEFSEKAFPSNYSRSWAKDGNGDWVLILQGFDVASGRKSRTSITFERMQNGEETVANPVRINDDGRDISDTIIPNIFQPMAEKVGEAVGRYNKQYLSKKENEKISIEKALAQKNKQDIANHEKLTQSIIGKYSCELKEQKISFTSLEKGEVQLDLANVCGNRSTTIFGLKATPVCTAESCDAVFIKENCKVSMSLDLDGLLLLTSKDSSQRHTKGVSRLKSSGDSCCQDGGIVESRCSRLSEEEIKTATQTENEVQKQKNDNLQKSIQNATGQWENMNGSKEGIFKLGAKADAVSLNLDSPTCKIDNQEFKATLSGTSEGTLILKNGDCAISVSYGIPKGRPGYKGTNTVPALFIGHDGDCQPICSKAHGNFQDGEYFQKL